MICRSTDTGSSIYPWTVPSFEKLESRLLLSAGILLRGHVLYAAGDADSDTKIVVSLTPDKRNVSIAFNDGTPCLTAAGVVKRIKVFGGAGNDTISVDETNGALSRIKLELNGMDGSDTITGGSGADTLRGGTGTDMLDGGKGHDRIFGGPDNDTIKFDPADRIVHDGGHDFIVA